MPEKKALKDMTEGELEDAMVKKYGPDFDCHDLDYSDPLVIEYFDRVARGM